MFFKAAILIFFRSVHNRAKHTLDLTSANHKTYNPAIITKIIDFQWSQIYFAWKKDVFMAAILDFYRRTKRDRACYLLDLDSAYSKHNQAIVNKIMDF